VTKPVNNPFPKWFPCAALILGFGFAAFMFFTLFRR
jgi:hypothetical protein